MTSWREVCYLVDRFHKQNLRENVQQGKIFMRSVEVETRYQTAMHERGGCSYDPLANCDAKYQVELNHYPYDLADDVIHAVLWCREPWPAPKVDALLAQTPFLTRWITNPPQWQSQPDRPHVHVFIHVPPDSLRQQVWNRFQRLTRAR